MGNVKIDVGINTINGIHWSKNSVRKVRKYTNNIEHKYYRRKINNMYFGIVISIWIMNK